MLKCSGSEDVHIASVGRTEPVDKGVETVEQGPSVGKKNFGSCTGRGKPWGLSLGLPGWGLDTR